MKSVLDSLKILFSDFYFLLVIVLCISLFIFKYPYFELPYFSDELWVYGPSLRKMGNNFPSLIPTALNIDEHWGHPLMYFFIGSIWCLLFGTSIVSTHVFAAITSTLLLLVIYYIAKKIFNRQLAFFTVLILASQSIFLGQYNLVLPEIMLTLFMFISLYAYINHKTLLYIVSGACLVLIKETGVLFIGAILLWHFFKNVYYKKNYKLSLKSVKLYIVLVLPLLFIVIHLLMLRYFYGWFIMPERIGHFTFTWEIYYDRIRDAFYYVFINQGRKPITLILFVALILFYQKIKIWKRVLLFIFVFSLVKIFFNYWKLPTIFPMVIVPICVLVLTKFLFWDNYKVSKEKGSFIGVLTLFIFIYILFSASQFDSLRYLLCIIPMILILVFYVVQTNIDFFKKWLIPILSCVILVSSITYIVKDQKFGDDTLNYKDVCLVNLQAVNYLEEKKYYNEDIKTSFLFKHQLVNQLAGYLSSSKYFMAVDSYKNEDSKYDEKSIYIFSNADLPSFYNRIKESNQFQLEKKMIQGLIWVEIYIPKSNN